MGGGCLHTSVHFFCPLWLRSSGKAGEHLLALDGGRYRLSTLKGVILCVPMVCTTVYDQPRYLRIQLRASNSMSAYGVMPISLQLCLKLAYSTAVIFVVTVRIWALSHRFCRVLSTSSPPFPP